MSSHTAYRELLRLYRERALLESCMAALEWDEETNLPPGGVELRAEQQAFLARLEHERAVDPRIGDLLAEAEAVGFAADTAEAVNLRELRKEYDEARRVPVSLIEELARHTTRAQAAWQEARDRGAVKAYLPVLTRVVELVRSWADCLRGERSRYDACLDEWEPGLTEREVVALLDELRPRLIALLDRVAGATPPAAPAVLDRTVALPAQREVSRALAGWLGFDLTRGRLDEAAHPSTMRLGPGDVRLTTRYLPARPFAGLFSTLHEIGHGLYDQNLPVEHYGTPIGEPSSLALHESQSRLVENLIGRSAAFWRFALPRIQALVAPAFDDVDPDGIHAAVNQVARTANRMQADEISYDLHIGVRVDLERALIAGDLAVADLPGAWADAYAADLVRPDDAASGFLQDGHWAAGMFGYFPTYTLGNVIAAQLFAAVAADHADLDEQMAAGRFGPVLDWLRDRVHRHGGHLRCRTVVERATGAPIGVTAQLDRLTAKFGALYRL